MRKQFISLFILSLLSINIFAEKRIVVFNPTCEGLSESEETWLPASVRRKLESNLNEYTNCQLIELQNESKIKELQKKAEGSAYDESTAIELGKLVSAEYGVFSVITKANGKYILSSSITNLTTGIRLSTDTTDSVADCSKLFEGAGSCVNLITVKFCNDLGYPLSNIDKYTLLKGDNLSDAEQIKLTEQEITNYNQKKEELEKRLKEIKLSVELDAESRRAKLEADKALLEQQQLIAKERLERLKKQQEQLLIDQKEQLARSAEQKKRIESVAAEAERKASELRNKNLENLSLDGQIAVIEAKKQALLDIYKDIEEQSNIIVQNAQADYDKRADEIDDEPLRKGEMDLTGAMLPDVKIRRNNAKKKIKEEIEAQAEKDINALRNKTSAQIKELEKDIEEDQKQLTKKRTVSSLDDNRILFVGNYDGQKAQWDTVVSFYINDYCLFSQNANINYHNVTGKSVIKASDSDSKWNDYLDTVDLYDYMFRRKVPVVALEIDYSIEALDVNYPSEYKINIKEFRYVDIRNDKVFQTITPSRTTYKFGVTPAVDLSPYYETSKNSTSAKVETKPKKTTEKKIKEKRKKNPAYDQSAGNGGRLNLGFNAGSAIQFPGVYEEKGTFIWDLYMTIPLGPYFFLIGDLGATHLGTENVAVCSNKDYTSIIYMDGGVGLNFRIPMGTYYPNLYVAGTVGGAITDNLYLTHQYYNTHYGKYDASKIKVFTCRAKAGLDIPLNELYCATLEYSYTYLSYLEWSHTVMVGLAVSL